MNSNQYLEEGIVGLKFDKSVVVFFDSFLKKFLVLRFVKFYPNHALSRRNVVFFGTVNEDKFVLIGLQ